MNPPRFRLLAGMIVAAAASRLLPHPPNYTPIAAPALFGGATFADRRWAFALPWSGLALSDLWPGLHPLLSVVYGSFAVTVCLGFLLRRRRDPLAIASAAFAGSWLFFLLTNLGVWAVGGLYPRTWPALWACYGAAIPFFRHTCVGEGLFTLALFGGLALAEKRFPLRRPATVAQARQPREGARTAVCRAPRVPLRHRTPAGTA